MNRTQRLLRLSAWTLGAATLLAAPALHAQDAPPAVDPAQFSACLNELKAAPAFSRITGFSAAEALGRPVSLFTANADATTSFDQLCEQLNPQGFWEGEVEATDKVVNHYKGKCQCESGGYMDGICFNCGLPIE